jgi:Acetoacetate decarboxylase (ADC)
VSEFFSAGVRYRMPVSFGPAIGPRQHPEGRMWTAEETGTMSSDWMKVSYRVDREKLVKLLPPGFTLRGEPVLSVSCAWFRNLYWLAGRGYGILSVDFPVTYRGKTETLEGSFCPVIWEGRPEALITGRDELGFPKMPADFTEIARDRSAGTASCSVSSMDFTFCDVSLTDLIEETDPPRVLPGSGGGPQLYYKYVPRTNAGGGAGPDAAYAVTAAPRGRVGGAAQNISFDGFDFRRWTGRGAVSWHSATFEQLPLTFPVVAALDDLGCAGFVDAEIVSFSGPGIAIATSGMRPIEGMIAYER